MWCNIFFDTKLNFQDQESVNLVLVLIAYSNSKMKNDSLLTFIYCYFYIIYMMANILTPISPNSSPGTMSKTSDTLKSPNKTSE